MFAIFPQTRSARWSSWWTNRMPRIGMWQKWLKSWAIASPWMASPPPGHHWKVTGQQAGRIECERSKESASTGLGARTKAKVRAPSSSQHTSKEGRSTCGIGGSPSVRRISCCSSGMSSWRAIDGCLNKVAKELAATLKYPHHVGAGGAETESW